MRTRIVVVDREPLVFNALHLGTEFINPRILGYFISVIVGSQPSEQERHSNHVLDGVITVRKVVERPGLVDDADGGFLCADADVLDVRSRFPKIGKFLVEDVSALTAVWAWNSAG